MAKGRKKARKAVRGAAKRAKLPRRAPSIAALGRQLDRVKCGHLMGREVIEKQISDLALGASAGRSYCQNWTRCPDNGWGLCTPDAKRWASRLSRGEQAKLFSRAELAVIKKLKSKRA
jgi:hypothetical protein